jgi:hypothetical protein
LDEIYHPAVRGIVVKGKSAPVELEVTVGPTGSKANLMKAFNSFFRTHHLGASLMDVQFHHLFIGHQNREQPQFGLWA